MVLNNNKVERYKGRQIVGKIKETDLVLDWNFLRGNYGLRRETEQLDNAIGRLLITIGVIGVFAITVFYINNRVNPISVIWDLKSLPNILFWASYLVLVYSFFLMRNRERFWDTLKMQNLEKLRKQIESGSKVEEIDLALYFSNNLLNLFDDILKTDGSYFLEEVIKRLLLFDTIKEAIPRMGLTVDKFQNISSTLGVNLNTHMDQWIVPLFLNGFTIALDNNFEKVDEIALFTYLCKVPLQADLLKNDISENDIEALELWVKNVKDMQRFAKMYKLKSALKPISTVNRAFTSRYSPTLIRFSRDYTREVIREDFIYSMGREDEVNKLIEMLESGLKKAVLIIGAPGVGKTTFLKSLAVRMVVEDVPPVLRDKRLVGFDFTRAFAMSKSIEVFKGRFENVLEEVEGAKNIILVIDDLYQLVNIRPEYTAEVIGILAKAMDTYNLRLVCTTTPEGYSKHIKPQQALVSMFDTMEMAEPSDEVALQILLDELPDIEKRYNVEVGFEALQKVIKLSHKFAFERVLPDKALDLIEEACVRAVNEKLKFVTVKHVDELVSEKVGVNVGVVNSDEAKSLIGMEQKLHKRVIGQEEAVMAVAAAMRRSRTGLTSDKRPIASFLFFGPTGVGKTELSKAVAAVYYGDEKMMIRLDMSEYQEEQNVSRLIGKAEGEKFEGGYLTEAVRQKPFSLILLDEIEKANPRVLDLFLQILDEGTITDGMGRKITFKNTIIIATSNVASREIADAMDKGEKYGAVLEKIMPQLRKFLRVEFLNRFDKVVMFRPLTMIDVTRIASIMMDKVKAKLSEQGIQLVYSKELLEEVSKLGYNKVYGARELQRVIQDNVEDKIATIMLEKNIKSGGVIEFTNLNKIVADAD